jgi:hypothetical protein
VIVFEAPGRKKPPGARVLSGYGRGREATG